MGTEALSKTARRDIRRAFAPEASAELLRFVESCEQTFTMLIAERHNSLLAHLDKRCDGLTAAVDQLEARLDLQAKIRREMTLCQRFRWLMTGHWL